MARGRRGKHLLTALEVERARRHPSKVPYTDGGNLYLVVKGEEGKADNPARWEFRYRPPGYLSRTGKKGSRHHGLGSLDFVPLKEARRKAEACRHLLGAGIDPIEHHREQKRRALEERAKNVTFKWCAEQKHSLKKPDWKDGKHVDQWINSLRDHAFDTIGDMLVGAISFHDVLNCLEPIWNIKRETGRRVRGRIEEVLDWATVHQYRQGPNPARWKGNLDQHLARGTTTRPQPSLHYGELPAFMIDLRANGSTSALALEFLIITASRTKPITLARLPDIQGDVWVVPGNDMKRTKAHKSGIEPFLIPLAPRAIEIVEEMKRRGATDYLFPGGKRGSPLSSAAMAELLKGMKAPDGGPWMDKKQNRPAVPHGFRATYDSWANDRTTFPEHIREASLSHAIKDKTVAAYQRGDSLDHRRKLINEWADYCASTPVKAEPRGEVVSIRATG